MNPPKELLWSFLGLRYRILNMNPQKGTTMEPMGRVMFIQVPWCRGAPDLSQAFSEAWQA